MDVDIYDLHAKGRHGVGPEAAVTTGLEEEKNVTFGSVDTYYNV
jgi:hypothetical protein